MDRSAISSLQLRVNRWLAAFDGKTAIGVTPGKNNASKRQALRRGKKRHGITLYRKLNFLRDFKAIF
jgi:hypothetical protein